MVVGLIYFNPNNKPSSVGFEFAGGIYTKVLPRGFAYSDLLGINNLGEAVGGGGANSGSSFLSFSFAQNVYTRLKIHSATALGVNDAGTIAGEYGSVGFLYQKNGTFQPIVFPGSSVTGVQGINNSGAVAGFFHDVVTQTHGFTWTPPASEKRKETSR